ncbi:hypothetical protein ES703_74430 [subsurface metagenome]
MPNEVSHKHKDAFKNPYQQRVLTVIILPDFSRQLINRVFYFLPGEENAEFWLRTHSYPGDKVML